MSGALCVIFTQIEPVTSQVGKASGEAYFLWVKVNSFVNIKMWQYLLPEKLNEHNKCYLTHSNGL